MGNNYQRGVKRFAALVCAALVGLALVGWVAFSLWSYLGGDRPRGATAGGGLVPLPGGIKPVGKTVNLPVILLADYYEHGVEHAPPRDPSGAMQRRERYYRAPAHPYALARGKLGTSPEDRQVQAWLESRQSAFAAGQAMSPGELSRLPALLDQCSLTAEIMLQMARAFEFLEGDAFAIQWYRAGIARAQKQYAKTQPGDPSAGPLLQLLAQMKIVWRVQDYVTMEQRFDLVSRLNAPLSVEARRGAHMRSVGLFYQGRYNEAADLILAVQAQHDKVGDLGALEKSDFEELAWLKSLCLVCAQRHEESLPYLQTVLKLSGRDRQMSALNSLAHELQQLGREDEARKYSAQLREMQPAAPRAAGARN